MFRPLAYRFRDLGRCGEVHIGDPERNDVVPAENLVPQVEFFANSIPLVIFPFYPWYNLPGNVVGAASGSVSADRGGRPAWYETNDLKFEYDEIRF